MADKTATLSALQITLATKEDTMSSKILMLIFQIISLILGPIKDYLLKLDSDERTALLESDPKKNKA